MAWTAPMTAVANTAFTAAQFNTHVRDNLLETSPGKSTGSVSNGSIPVKSGTNAISMRTPTTAYIGTSQSTSTTSSWVNLSTSGPTVTVTAGTQAIVILGCSLQNNSNNSSLMGFTVTNGGVTTHAADESAALRHRDGTGTGGEESMSHVFMVTGLTAGSNTFTSKYKVFGGTGTYRYRRMTVIPL